MHLKIPPPVVFIVTAAMMWGVNYLTGTYLAFSFAGQTWVSRIFFMLCMVFVLAGIYAFSKLKTTVDPRNPDDASSLVTIGVYRITRNPMYVGMLFLLLGWLIRLGNPTNVLLLIFFIWYMTKFQIQPEEEALRKNFGATFDDYCKKVRRWL